MAGVRGRQHRLLHERRATLRAPGALRNRARPRRRIDLSYDVDWGKTVSEASLQVTLARWQAPPGSVVLLEGFGPPDGRWLVSTISRDYFQPTAEVKLVQPAKELLEPANEQTSRTERTGGIADAEVGAGDQTNMAFMNTPVTHGSGIMLVTATGRRRPGRQDRRHADGVDEGTDAADEAAEHDDAVDRRGSAGDDDRDVRARASREVSRPTPCSSPRSRWRSRRSRPRCRPSCR